MTDPLTDALNALQAQAYIDGTTPRPADPDWRLNYEAAARDIFGPDAMDDLSVRRLTDDAVAAASDGVPTRFEDPVTYHHLATAVDAIERALERLGLNLGSHPLVGTLPLPCVEPVTADVHPAADGHLVLFESQFVPFGLLLATTVGDQLGAPGAPRRFSDLLQAYAVSGRPGAIGVLPGDPGPGTATALGSAMLLFAVAHEYAHVVLGHLHRARRRSDLLPRATPSMTWSRTDELDADMVGIRLAAEVAAHEGIAFGTVLQGADLLFSALDIMDRTIALLRFGDETAGRTGFHPPGQERRNSLRQIVFRITDAQARHTVAAATTAAEQQQEELEKLWIHARPVLAQHRDDGVTAHPRWHSGPPEQVFTRGE
jgi:hypothetical protein